MKNFIHTKTSPIGNSESFQIKPAVKTPPLSKWTAIMEKMTVWAEPEWAEWDVTLSNGLDPWEE